MLDALRSKITRNGKLDSASMEHILEQRRDALDTLFGPLFTRNFNRVYQAAKLIDTTAPRQAKINAFESKLTENVLRATVAPPLTNRGRMLTLGTWLRSSAYRQRVADIFTNPEALAEMAKYSDRAMTAQMWANVTAKALSYVDD